MSVTETVVDFNRLEREIFRKCCEAGCEALKEQLKKWDSRLRETRDRAIYRHKGLRKAVIKTVMGEVEYSRALYVRENGDGTKRSIYLLDEAMGKAGSGFMSGLLAIRRHGMSYRRWGGV